MRQITNYKKNMQKTLDVNQNFDSIKQTNGRN